MDMLVSFLVHVWGEADGGREEVREIIDHNVYFQSLVMGQTKTDMYIQEELTDELW